ncbi:uncharacterized protein LOC124145774 isoform X2 [Haliotis rufescens]|uniref:uncharacterized protein LOC124145774 isoform X2 n=1 Tax=Haliotis rufescens TaxID=6454 RepID=UPI00201F5626|nr:uncharacterized protein LOC124145774 isoform X2 [Haliotis rufescens]
MSLDHETCTKCERYSKEFNKRNNSLCVHLEVTCFNSIWDEEKQKPRRPSPELKKKKKEEIKRSVSALRNSLGGQLLVHLEGLSPEDPSQGNFDEFIDDDLQTIINVDETFDDVYYKKTLQEDPEFVVIDIEPSSTIIITDPKTKFIIDKGFTPDSAQALRFFLKHISYQQDPHHSEVKHRQPFLNDETIQTINEKRDIQLKGFVFNDITKEQKKKEEILRDPEQFVDHLWDLRLPLYVTAFAKLKGGGSYILGIGEEEKKFSTVIKGQTFQYMSKSFEVHGIELPTEKYPQIEHLIEQRLKGGMCSIDYKGESLDWNDIHITAHFHDIIEEGRVLLEIVVNPITGVLFYDNKGPEAYKVEHREPFLKCTRCELKDIITSVTKH